MTAGRELIPRDGMTEEIRHSDVVSAMTRDEINRLFKIAEALAASGIYDDSKQANRAFAKLIIGRDLGLNIAQSMQGIQFVRGQVQLHYSLLALCIRSRGYSWKEVERTPEKAAATFVDPDGIDLERVEFTMQEAIAQGLVDQSRPKNGGKSMYEKFPKVMLWARMMSQAVRFVIPEATGGVPVYVPGELPPTVDGGASREEVAAAQPPTLAEVELDAPEELRGQVAAAFREAEEVRPGVVSGAAARMEIKGQPAERVKEYILRLERENAIALGQRQEREEIVTEAQVVDDDEEQVVDPAPSSENEENEAFLTHSAPQSTENDPAIIETGEVGTSGLFSAEHTPAEETGEEP